MRSDVNRDDEKMVIISTLNQKKMWHSRTVQLSLSISGLIDKQNMAYTSIDNVTMLKEYVIHATTCQRHYGKCNKTVIKQNYYMLSLT